jgi:hypothetical protein
MARYQSALADAPIWNEASAKTPCPCCGATDGCAVMADGQYVRCMTVVSQWPFAGGGWLHRLVDLSVAVPAGT